MDTSIPAITFSKLRRTRIAFSTVWATTFSLHHTYFCVLRAHQVSRHSADSDDLAKIKQKRVEVVEYGVTVAIESINQVDNIYQVLLVE